jgi:HK97 family phage major capsid protein
VLTYLRRLVDERTALTETMTNTAETAAADDRSLTDAEQIALAGMQARCAEIDVQLEQHNSQAESMRAFADLTTKIEQRREQGTERTTVSSTRVEQTSSGQASSGQAFVDSDNFRSYKGYGQSQPFDVDGYLETRVPINTSNLAIPHFVLPPVEQVSSAPLLEVCGRVQVSSGVVDWVEVGPDPVASIVAEGAPKPEATFTMTPKTASLNTIAHWISITRQALDDASYMRSLIETKLRRGLIKKAEQDMAAALVAATLPTATAADLLAAIRVGIGTVEGAGYNPNAVVLNPADYAALDVAAMEASNSGPTRSGSYWGLRAVAVPSQPAGTATVGDFAAGATLFDRGVSSVFVTDSHADLFISNILLILAEARIKSAVTELPAFCECTGTP